MTSLHPSAALLCLLAVLTSGPLLADADLGPPEPRQADAETLQRLIADSRVETTAPKPGLALWVQDAAAALSRSLAGLLERFMPGFGAVADRFLRILTLLLYTLLVLLVLLIAGRLARRWWQHRQPVPAEQRVVVADAEAAAPQLGSDWEAELRRRLENRDLAAAVEALWWWLASVLLPAGVESSWTSRELIARAGRRDLGPQVRRLDRMIYGPEPPAATEVGNLFRDLREAVG